MPRGGGRGEPGGSSARAPRRSRGHHGRRRGLVGETWFPPRDGAGGGGGGMSVATETRLDAAIEDATARLLELQHAGGYWVGELESNVTMTAQHLFWHHVLGLRTPELDRKIGNELLARRRDDGTGAIWFEGPPDLSTSIEAYVACPLAGANPGPRPAALLPRRGG